MKKIVVATDFSVNSKKAIFFAIQLASQTNAELLFYNVADLISIPSAWGNLHNEQLEGVEIKTHQKQLEKFILEIYKDSSLSKVKYQCVCEIDNEIASRIISYAKKSKADFICVSARGAGILDKLFGSITSELITTSSIPVFVVPNNYHSTPITTICYASDIENIDIEIGKVIKLASSVKAKITVLHYDYTAFLKGDEKRLNDLVLKYQTDGIKFQYKKTDPTYPLKDQLRESISSIKPSLVVLFTKQNRNWFDRLFTPNVSANMSLNAKTPMLVFRK